LLALNNIIPWSNESKYLGIYITSGPRFKCSFEKTKIKFYRAVNAILLAKLGGNNNAPVTLKLLESIALPVLLYLLEALLLNKTELLALDHAWNRVFEKVFKTFDKDVTKQCQLFSGYLDVAHYYSLRTMSFLSKLASSPNLLVKQISLHSGHVELFKLATRPITMFNSNSDNFAKCYKRVIYNNFFLA